MANAYKYKFTPDEAVELLYQKGFIGGSSGFLQELIDTSINLEENNFFWREHFIVEGSEYDIDLASKKKNPAWTVVQRTPRSVPMADAMAPLSDTAQLDNEDYEEKTGSIYQYGKGLFETSMSKEELKARLLELNIQDRSIILGYVRGVRDLIRSHNSRLSFMAAQVLSKGGAYTNASTRGFSGVSTVQSAYIPASNFITAGAKAWNDMTAGAECDIPSQMQKIEDDFRQANNLSEDFALVWNIPYSLVTTVMLNNPYFKEQVNRYIRLYAPDKVVVITSGGSTSTDAQTITIEQLIAYSNSDVSKISPIQVIKQQSTVQTFTTTTTASGWEAGVAVLRPIGYAGVVVHATPSDVKLMRSGEVNNGVQWSMAKVQNFLYIINKITPNGMLKSYHTDAIGRYAPVLNESNYHLVVDTTTADD